MSGFLRYSSGICACPPVVYDSQGEQNSSVPADNFFAQPLLRRRCLHVGIEPIESPVPETAYGCDVPAAGALLDQRGAGTARSSRFATLPTQKTLAFARP